MRIAALRDLLQEGKPLDFPEIRVWVHPIEGGDDYCETFDSFVAAKLFIMEHSEEAETVPLIAFQGYELNLWALAPEG